MHGRKIKAYDLGFATFLCDDWSVSSSRDRMSQP